MRVVLLTRGSQWIEDWEAKTPRAVAAMFALKYCHGQRPLETGGGSQYSHVYIAPDHSISIGILALQPERMGHITPISIARYGTAYTFERRYVDGVKQLDQATVLMGDDPDREQQQWFVDLTRTWLRRFGRSVGVK